ncbi:hypothetical protein [Allofranklinella schreckenbergeri]|uniref:hypothetical protein n=1 Tax=Allofranklinella schreckenbergeri TaxID=1076744 RepID=UPI001EEDF8D2|nr:hypothetical protein [Allofranklinella schreckenbergeri]
MTSATGISIPSAKLQAMALTEGTQAYWRFLNLVQHKKNTQTNKPNGAINCNTGRESKVMHSPKAAAPISQRLGLCISPSMLQVQHNKPNRKIGSVNSLGK